ncbi:hypothetical protein MHLP_03050 [Candidatus Mycoplasma haematolamae str. Purdue]|uniref:Uncharacterized protein n=1 Tax=Mycoplasma haematolamae (strain Purdue) TaxID=1212765 RepID=I7BA74_MYCHA|nr:hypothetical protein [Candidatus Mycoplasma haematolamae]AFO52190.1 hypothetical protein MHLP_03050 [Candidatus Mycoplasma haematolamae str. Purdue]
MKLLYKVAAGTVGLLAIGGSSGAVATTTLTASSNKKEAKPTTPKAPEFKKFTLKFPDQTIELECPNNSYLDETYLLKEKALALACRRKISRWDMQEEHFRWADLGYHKTLPACSVLNKPHKTIYQCWNGGNLPLSIKETESPLSDPTTKRVLQIG